MKNFDYVILGGGCAGLSLAYELEVSGALGQKSLAIVEPRGSYSRDKTWSFWRTDEHNFGDCVTSRWNSFKVIGPSGQTQVNCEDTPYESVDSGRFYRKVLDRLAGNNAIQFVPSSNHLQLGDALVFNSVPRGGHPERLWQHFRGVELVAPPGTFDSSSVTLMDFVCEQRGQVHFFYVLPFSSSRALVETTWIGPLTVGSDDMTARLTAI